MGQQPTVCLVTAGGDHPWAIAAALADRFGEGLVVVEEEPEGKRRLIARRARSRGWANALGQLGTMAVIRIGKGLFGWRIRRTLQRKGLEIAPRPGQRIVRVPSVNSDAFIHFISDLEPDLLFLAGCRLMTAGTLRAMPCRVVNYHAGITPAYRGMNGGYWALVQGEPENFGTTVHFVDEGIDTGLVLAQVRCQATPSLRIRTRWLPRPSVHASGVQRRFSKASRRHCRRSAIHDFGSIQPCGLICGWESRRGSGDGDRWSGSDIA